jgi:hypothetical protein
MASLACAIKTTNANYAGETVVELRDLTSGDMICAVPLPNQTIPVDYTQHDLRWQLDVHHAALYGFKTRALYRVCLLKARAGVRYVDWSLQGGEEPNLAYAFENSTWVKTFRH